MTKKSFFGEGFCWGIQSKPKVFNPGEKCENCGRTLSIYNNQTICESCRRAGVVGRQRDGKKRHPLHMGIKNTRPVER